MKRSTGNNDPHQMAPRLFVTAAPRPGVEIAAAAEQAHYLATVLRRASGDMVRLFDGLDGEWLARLTVARRDKVILTVVERLREQRPEAGPWLLFAPLKRDATDLVVRQAVELGVSRILPVITERTNAARVNTERLRAIAIEAAEQSERLTVPIVDPPARLDAVLAAWPADRRLFAALERSWDAEAGGTRPDHDRAGAGPLTQHRAGSAPDATVRHAALLIGPEGGFTTAEREMLLRARFVTPISLGPYVLRAETAAVAGLALLLGTGWAEYVTPNLKRSPESPSTVCPIQ